MRKHSLRRFSSVSCAVAAAVAIAAGCSSSRSEPEGSAAEAQHRPRHDGGDAADAGGATDAGAPGDGSTSCTAVGPSTSWHYASGDYDGTFPAGAFGFNLADVSSAADVSALPAGVKAVVWLGVCNGADANFVSTMQAFIPVASKILAFYLMDEPDPTGQFNPTCPIANLLAESDYIHANVPGGRTFITMMNMGSSFAPSYAGTYNPANSHIDYYGLDPYPCRTDLNGCDNSMIAPNVQAALNFGIPLSAIVPVYQTFGGGGWVDDTGGAYLVPTAAQENALLATWRSVVPTPAWDYAYAWGSQNNDTALAQSPTLQQVLGANFSGTCGDGGGGCTPKTCAALGADCGSVSDGCGGTLDCGTCTAPQTCGGGGAPNKCGGGSAGGAITYRQGTSGELGTPATSITLPLSNVAAGDLLVGWFLEADAPGQVTVSDNLNGAWTRSGSEHYDGGSAGDVALYYKANSAAGNVTITVAASAATFIQATVAEYAGASATSPIDQVLTTHGNGATASAGPTAALSVSNELVYAAVSVGAVVSSMSAGPGFTLRSSPSADATGEEDAIASSTAGQSASMPFGNATDWNMVIATIRPAGGSCTPTTCAAQGKNCGTIPDGCGGTLNCGVCTAPQTCGGGGTPNVCGGGTSAVPHVMLILMENHGFHDIIGSSSAPFLNSLAQNFASATAWQDVTHPSLPNYLALTAGSVFTTPPDCIQAGSRPTGDCVFGTAAPNLADQLTAAGIAWKAYIEDLPFACDTTDNFGPNNYDVNHNPFMYYSNVINSPAECNNDVPFTQLATDIANNALPSFIWVSPNLIHDMHDGTIADGDNFLKSLVPQIQATSWYTQGGVILITWDEGETEEQIVLLAVSAKNAGKGAFTTAGNHYGVLRGIEEEYGLSLLGSAANAANGDIKPLLP